MYTFHSIIKSNYIEVHEWLLANPKVPHYKAKNALTRVNKALKTPAQVPALESAVLQYYVYFPAHSAKVGYALENIICFDRLFDWLSYGAEAIVIDVGCGAGAASVAFANCLLKLRESRFMPHPISVHFIGIDPNEYAIAIYHQQITGLISNLKKFNINGSYSIIPEGDLEAVNQLREKLAERRELLNVPFLGHVFLFQANVVSPFSALFQERQLKRQNMLALGIPEESLSDLNKLFGQEEAMAYKQILESTFIDNLHVITVGTNGYEERVAELAQGNRS